MKSATPHHDRRRRHAERDRLEQRRAPTEPAASRSIVCALLLLASSTLTFGADRSPSIYVDDDGVMRWSTSKQEVALFGVNYTAPLRIRVSRHQRLGIPIEKAIDADVYHLARLGLDAYRVHVWDREISDAEGNVLSERPCPCL